MNVFEQIAEEKIQRAMEAGEFDHLAGRGKPLNLVQNPFEAPEDFMANHLLRTQGFTLPWIEMRAEIEHDLEATRRNLAATLELVRSGTLELTSEAEARAYFEEQIQRINRRIFLYNLQAPTPLVQRPLIQLPQELAQFLWKNQPMKS